VAAAWGGEGIIHHLECHGRNLILTGKGLNQCDARDAPASQIHGCRWRGYRFGALGEMSNGGGGGGRSQTGEGVVVLGEESNLRRSIRGRRL
jgi:hypothetical protein